MEKEDESALLMRLSRTISTDLVLDRTLILVANMARQVIEAETLVVEHKARVEEPSRRAVAETEHIRITLDFLASGVITTDERGRMQLLNPAAAEALGCTPAVACGRPPHELYGLTAELDGAAAPDPVTECLAQGHVVRLSNHVLSSHVTAHAFPVELTVSPVKGVDGKAVGCVIVFRDVSEAGSPLSRG